MSRTSVSRATPLSTSRAYDSLKRLEPGKPYQNKVHWCTLTSTAQELIFRPSTSKPKHKHHDQGSLIQAAVVLLACWGKTSSLFHHSSLSSAMTLAFVNNGISIAFVSAGPLAIEVHILIGSSMSSTHLKCRPFDEQRLRT